ncbi:1-aminocyclopropane-1-carboxylate deaminase [Nonlabens ulvanivorans]|uniref:1-aminocyclopropane-1-carboxylate deaminase n=1 Tax=Nonlabens ulvanivorans TaxID=906888 RepID=A0A081DEY5_NONUL|nr:pyridoxal-phosphate dependent enzyme [Nonlabens ulvanivorans]GAK77481.1 1-aminocyclopropane-1-carboxylate deaminase [Nonlabens ulvanivorans]
MKLFNVKNTVNQRYREFNDGAIIVDIKREDLLHTQVSGNKLRKLKYNILAAQRLGLDTLLTYGGAFSNHIAATAAAGNICGFKTIGVIRGEELGHDLEKTLAGNKTLNAAHALGMQFKFVSRSAYRGKYEDFFQFALKKEFDSFFNIPEGGTNDLAVKGTEEILTIKDKDYYDYICVAAGTGGTAAGIINSTAPHQKVLVFSALKGDFMFDEIAQYTDRANFMVFDENRFGGYAKSSDGLIKFMNGRFRESVTEQNPKGIPLEPIYTGKMMYRLEHLVKTGVISGETRILAIHTGGLQSVAGYNAMLEKKGKITLDYINEI